jgi:hypothetical protein
VVQTRKESVWPLTRMMASAFMKPTMAGWGINCRGGD